MAGTQMKEAFWIFCVFLEELMKLHIAGRPLSIRVAPTQKQVDVPADSQLPQVVTIQAQIFKDKMV